MTIYNDRPSAKLLDKPQRDDRSSSSNKAHEYGGIPRGQIEFIMFLHQQKDLCRIAANGITPGKLMENDVADISPCSSSILGMK